MKLLKKLLRKLAVIKRKINDKNKIKRSFMFIYFYLMMLDGFLAKYFIYIFSL